MHVTYVIGLPSRDTHQLAHPTDVPLCDERVLHCAVPTLCLHVLLVVEMPYKVLRHATTKTGEEG